MQFEDYIKIYITLFVVTEPLGTMPIFLAITENFPEQRKKIAKITSFSCFIVMIISQYAGKYLLPFFGISIDAFRVAGGILLLIVSLEMINARISRSKHTPKEDREALDSSSVAVVPLALPLLTGPGAISTIIVFSNNSEHYYDKFVLTFLLLLASLTIWVFLYFADNIKKRISATGMNVISRVMGLILASMAIEFIFTGTRNLLPGLAG
jgi:multiple antibiotic resistance protein